MEQSDEVRTSRTPDELAAEIEPLAQAMATLADDAREQIAGLQKASREQATAWSTAQTAAAAAWKTAAQDMRTAAQALRAASDQARETATISAAALTTRIWIVALTAALTPILVLAIASWIWLDPRVVADAGRLWILLGPPR